MSDELTAALRALAAQHETPPCVDATEIRSRARRRYRRRRVFVALSTAAMTVCVMTAVAFTLHSPDPVDSRHRTDTASDTPVPSAVVPPRAPRPSGQLDLGLRALTVRDRVLRVDSRSFDRLPPGTRLTVVSKEDTAVLPLEGRPRRRAVRVPHVVELRTPDGEPVYAGALDPVTRGFAGFLGRTDWLDMSPVDAEWFYDQVHEGDGIELTSPAPATASDTVPPTGHTSDGHTTAGPWQSEPDSTPAPPQDEANRPRR